MAFIITGTAEIGGIQVYGGGIDHQFAAAIVATQFKGDLIVGFEEEARIDRLAHAVLLLVGHRFVQQDVAGRGRDDEVAGAIGLDGSRAHEVKADRRGVGFGSHDKVELSLALGTVEGQIHAGVDTLIGNAGVMRNVGLPLAGIVTDEVVALAGHRTAG